MEASMCNRQLGISLSLEVNLEVTAPPRDLQHDPRSEAEGAFWDSRGFFSGGRIIGAWRDDKARALTPNSSRQKRLGPL